MTNVVASIICGLLFMAFFGACAIGGYRQNVQENEPENHWLVAVCGGFVLFGLDVVCNASVVADGPHHRNILDHPDGLGIMASVMIVVSVVGWIIALFGGIKFGRLKRSITHHYLRSHSIDWIDPKCGCQRSSSEPFDAPCLRHRSRASSIDSFDKIS
jgi:hypothetical protein